jgi:GNAT superfamily N-acetyltransferase
MALRAATRETLREYWAGRLGVAPDAFNSEGVTVGTTDEDGLTVFWCGDAVVVGAPEQLRHTAERQTDLLSAIDSTDGDEIRDWYGAFERVETVLGPAFWGYTDEGAFEPVVSSARVLGRADESAYASLREAVPASAWDNGGPAFVPGETVGLFVDDDLVAASGYDVWDDMLAHLAVVTHPDERGEGYGQAVVSRATELAVSEGLVPQYRTLAAWPWSVALAESLGFERFATGAVGL